MLRIIDNGKEIFFSDIFEVIEARPRSHGNTKMLTLLPVVRFGHVIPFLISAEPQDFIYDLDAHNGTRQRELRPVL